MEAIHCPSPSLPHSFSINQPTQPRSTQLFISFPKQRQPLPSLHLRVQALDNALSTVANSTDSPGDISVLLPVSALLIFVYWITNFVVPGMIMKDLQREVSDEEEEPQSE